MKAIEIKNNLLFCNRCGNHNISLFGKTPCPKCRECFYCRNCLWLGKLRMCEDIISKHIEYLDQDIKLNINYQLSPLQQAASDYIVDKISEKKDILIWAVCGAGKTEIVFQIILNYLINKKLVCFAIPRVDVVIELTVRLNEAFNIPIYAHYGGSPNSNKNSQLIVMTTHQLLKYKNIFDLIIIDEVDAFPYSTDQTLQYGLKKALKENGRIVYLTATPNRYFKKLIHNNEINHYIIPSRFHKHPLDLPRFIHNAKWEKPNQKLINIIQDYQNPLLIFLPTIELLEYYQKILKIEGVHSKSLNRTEIIQRFKDKKITKLLTTTILERGITIKNLDVIVIGAEHRLFDEKALVQICGRVGRKFDSPSGNIIFIYRNLSIEMIKAYLHIYKMNTLSKMKGYLK